MHILPIVVIWLRIWGACSVISAFIAFDIIEINDPKNDKPKIQIIWCYDREIQDRLSLPDRTYQPTSKYWQELYKAQKEKLYDSAILNLCTFQNFFRRIVRFFGINFETIPLHFSRWSAAKFRGGSGEGFKYKNKHFLLSSWYLK